MTSRGDVPVPAEERRLLPSGEDRRVPEGRHRAWRSGHGRPRSCCRRQPGVALRLSAAQQGLTDLVSTAQNAKGGWSSNRVRDQCDRGCAADQAQVGASGLEAAASAPARSRSGRSRRPCHRGIVQVAAIMRCLRSRRQWSACSWRADLCSSRDVDQHVQAPVKLPCGSKSGVG